MSDPIFRWKQDDIFPVDLEVEKESDGTVSFTVGRETAVGDYNQHIEHWFKMDRADLEALTDALCKHLGWRRE